MATTTKDLYRAAATTTASDINDIEIEDVMDSK